jgi:hypothetical protein
MLLLQIKETGLNNFVVLCYSWQIKKIGLFLVDQEDRIAPGRSRRQDFSW